MKVEVEIEDLETLLHATGVIKTIESSLRSYKEDPFVKPHLFYSEASNRLASAMNSARRAAAGTATPWDGELNDKEAQWLAQYSEKMTITEVTPGFRIKAKEIDTLAAKGCVKIGQGVKGAIWPGEIKADIRPTELYAVAITGRGIDKLRAYDAKQAELKSKKGD